MRKTSLNPVLKLYLFANLTIEKQRDNFRTLIFTTVINKPSLSRKIGVYHSYLISFHFLCTYSDFYSLCFLFFICNLISR